MSMGVTMRKVAKKIKEDNERGARASFLEDLFYDFNRSRMEIYKMNFVRGIFFGLGSVLGGTVLIALAAWILHFFVDIPLIGDSVRNAQQSIQKDKK
jgi:hypothetical protein